MERQESAMLLRPLDILVGTWDVEGSIPGRAVGAPGTGAAVRAVGRCAFEWILDGQFLLQRTEARVPDAPDSSSVIGYSSERDGLVQHYFDARGIARAYDMTFGGGRWTLLRQAADFSPLPFLQRFDGTLSADHSTIDSRWERSVDGETWEKDFDLVYRRRSG
jgi:hypothetical protein